MLYLKEIILSNSLIQFGIAAGIACFVFFILKLIQGPGLKKTRLAVSGLKSQWTEIVFETLEKTNSFTIVILAVWAGAQALILPHAVHSAFNTLGILAAFIQIGLWGSQYINTWASRYREAQLKTNPAAVTTVGALRMVLLPAIWMGIALLILDNLGVNITTLIAGVGIGGIAIALAVQNILKDLFSSLSIVMDKTFLVGDFLELDTYKGTVEYIGMKNTRIRSISGEQIIFTNSDLLAARIRNYGRMYERRIVNTFKVADENDQENLILIPQLIKNAVEKQEKTRFDRAHFACFKESGIEFEYVYYVTTPEYITYMNIQQGINLSLQKSFHEHKIKFSYPSQISVVKFDPEDIKKFSELILTSS